MNRSLRYRLASAVGVAGLTMLAVVLANQPLAQQLLTSIPVLDRLPEQTSAGIELTQMALTALVVVMLSFVPLFRPRPRRILDAVGESERRLFLAFVTLAAIGYFDWSTRLPRTTLLLSGAFLSVALPAWFVAIRPRPRLESNRVAIVGDDPETMEDILAATDLPVVGYVSPLSPYYGGEFPVGPSGFADGGVVTTTELDALECLGGLSRLEAILVQHDVDTVVLAFSQPNRAEFFGVLDTCDRLGVRAKVHRDHADVVLTTELGEGDLVDVDLEPWDWQDRAIKRVFDVTFAAAALIALIPIIGIISAAIKLDSHGPVLYAQERTAEFGERFTVYKFRSMVEDAEAKTGAKLSEEDVGGVDPRVTKVGQVLRQTHLDEIPQLWSILLGNMSVVGPRPERPELDTDIEHTRGVGEWRRRWFVKPGLTGLAQISGATGYDPETKLRYDVEYIRKQSFWYDLKIITRQMWDVVEDTTEILQI